MKCTCSSSAVITSERSTGQNTVGCSTSSPSRLAAAMQLRTASTPSCWCRSLKSLAVSGTATRPFTSCAALTAAGLASLEPLHRSAPITISALGHCARKALATLLMLVQLRAQNTRNPVASKTLSPVATPSTITNFSGGIVSAPSITNPPVRVPSPRNVDFFPSGSISSTLISTNASSTSLWIGARNHCSPVRTPSVDRGL
ncbi:hypothetical protein D3C84_526630 [compost metagenome]